MKAFKFLGIGALALSLVNCAPSAKQLKEAVEKDPSIVFAAIEKDPEQFIEVVNKAAQNAQKKAQEKAVADEGKKRDEEFKNPLKPEVEEGRVIFGPKDAKITIVEYSDFECPYCSKGHATVDEVMKAYPKDVRVVYKHLPLISILWQCLRLVISKRWQCKITRKLKNSTTWFLKTKAIFAVKKKLS